MLRVSVSCPFNFPGAGEDETPAAAQPVETQPVETQPALSDADVVSHSDHSKASHDARVESSGMVVHSSLSEIRRSVSCSCRPHCELFLFSEKFFRHGTGRLSNTTTITNPSHIKSPKTNTGRYKQNQPQTYHKHRPHREHCYREHCYREQML